MYERRKRVFSRLIIRDSIFLFLLGVPCAATFFLPKGEASSQEEGRMSGQDAHGDPLPKSAVARLGTIRLRQIEQTDSITFLRRGKHIASCSDKTCEARLWDSTTGKEIGHVGFPGRAQPNQRLLLSPNGNYLSYLDDPVIKVWEVSSKWTVPIVFSFAPIAFSSDSNLVAGLINRGLVIFDLKTWVIKKRLGGIDQSLHALAFSPDGKLIAASEGKNVVGETPNMIRLWDLGTGKEVGAWVVQCRTIESLCFNQDSKVLVSGGIGGVHLWDVASHRRLATLEDDAAFIAFSPRGNLLAVSGWTKKFNLSNEIHIWDPATRQRVRSIRVGSGGIRSFAFSPDGKKIATGGHEHAIRLWDVESGQQLLPLTGHEHTVFSIQFTPDGKSLASYSEDLTVRIWDLGNKKEQQRFLLGTQGVVSLGSGSPIPACSLAFSPDGKTLAAVGVPKEGDADNPVPLWDAVSGKTIIVIQTPKPKGSFYRPTAIAFSTDSKALATVNGGGNVQIWSSASAASLRLFPTSKGHPFINVAFSPDGRVLAGSQLAPNQILLWDWRSGRLVRAFPRHRTEATYLAFSPGGHMLASTSCRFQDNLSEIDKTIQLHEPATGTLIRTLNGQESSAACVAFSPNGRLLASAGQHDNAVRIWDVFTGKELAKFTGHRGPVYCAAFSPDGKTLASGSADTTILLWDVSKLQPEPPPSIAQNELANELPGLWEKMQAREGAEAYQAIWRLIGSGDDAVAFLSRRLDPVPASKAKLVQQCLVDLDSDNFEKRQSASEQLTKLRGLAEPALQQALQGKPSLEARKRLENLLANIVEQSLSDAELRQIRALHALELIGSPAARAVLKKLADGAPGARLTRDAKLALQRLQRRTAKP